MLLGLTGALAAAACYGLASVLQALGVRRGGPGDGAGPLADWRYLAGLVLDALGFVLSLGALRTLPLFLVQAVVASSLAVTAVVGSRVLALRLSGGDRVALVVVVGGLSLLGLSAAPGGAVDHARSEGWVVLLLAVLLGPVAAGASRVRGPVSGSALGAVAGLAFGVVAYAARTLTSSPGVDGPGALARTLLDEPAAYALLVGAGIALVTYALALQRGDVLGATACLVVAETVAPALAGLLLLGDRARPGWGGVAAAGFVLAVAGAAGLARHGDVSAVG